MIGDKVREREREREKRKKSALIEFELLSVVRVVFLNVGDSKWNQTNSAQIFFPCCNANLFIDCWPLLRASERTNEWAENEQIRRSTTKVDASQTIGCRPALVALAFWLAPEQLQQQQQQLKVTKFDHYFYVSVLLEAKSNLVLCVCVLACFNWICHWQTGSQNRSIEGRRRRRRQWFTKLNLANSRSLILRWLNLNTDKDDATTTTTTNKQTGNGAHNWRVNARKRTRDREKSRCFLSSLLSWLHWFEWLIVVVVEAVSLFTLIWCSIGS